MTFSVDVPDEKVPEYLNALPYSCIPTRTDVALLIQFLVEEEGWTPPPHIAVLKSSAASPQAELLGQAELLDAARAMVRTYDTSCPDWWPQEIEDLRDALEKIEICGTEG